MKRKTVYLLLFLITILGIILLAKTFIKPATPGTENNSVPIFRASSSPKNQQPYTGENTAFSGPLKITADNTKKEPILLNEQVILTFNKSVAPNDLAVELEPPTPFKVSVDLTSTKIIIEPATGWEFQMNYTLKVSKNSNALDKSSLDKDYEFHFNTVRYIGY